MSRNCNKLTILAIAEYIPNKHEIGRPEKVINLWSFSAFEFFKIQ
jgi:hypothetical protein